MSRYLSVSDVALIVNITGFLLQVKLYPIVKPKDFPVASLSDKDMLKTRRIQNTSCPKSTRQ